ncbi:MAG TPA: GtrA family protein [Anaerolineales bacterium]|nr:GtrA family protein [Anaerolineales bacterium]
MKKRFLTLRARWTSGKMKVQNKEWIRFYRFGLVGVLGAVVDFTVMNLLTRLLNFNLVIAGTISFILAVISNFIWNRLWTYPDSRSKKIEMQLIMFFSVNLIGIAIRIPILHFLEPGISQFLRTISTIPSSLIILLSNNITLALAILIVMLWNFYANRYWTYNDVN